MAKTSLSVKQYREEMRKLKWHTYLRWKALYRRVKLTDLEVVREMSRVKWGFVELLRDFQCAYCEYQKALGVGCRSCPVQKLCKARGELSAPQILEQLHNV